MKKSYILAATIFLVAGLWILSGQFGEPIHKAEVVARNLDVGGAAEKPTPVRIRAIYAEDHTRELVIFGRTEADRSVTLRAQTEGAIEALALSEGASVSEDELILQIALDDRNAKLAEAQASEQHYRLAYEAGQNLVAKSFRSRVNLAENKADWEAAKAELKQAELDIAHTRIAAPFAGVVDSIDVEVGDFLQLGDPIAKVVDLDPLVIAAEVTERDIYYVNEGGEATVLLTNGEARLGTVRFVAKTGSAVTRTFTVEVAVPNADYSIGEGKTAELRLQMGTTRAHLVSPAVLTLSEEGAVGVKAVSDDNRVVFHPIQIVADSTEGIWLAGLPDPLRLITAGQEFVRAGQLVTPVPESDIPTAAPIRDNGQDTEPGPLMVTPKNGGEPS